MLRKRAWGGGVKQQCESLGTGNDLSRSVRKLKFQRIKMQLGRGKGWEQAGQAQERRGLPRPKYRKVFI